MKRPAAVLLAMILVSFLACSTSTDPEDHPPDDPPLAEMTIGPEGGNLATGGFELSIPPGAFDGDVDLAVSLADGSDAPAHELASELFVLSGLPDAIHAPLRLAFEPTSPVEGDPVILLGQEGIHEEGLAWMTIEAELEGDQLVLDIPVYDVTEGSGGMRGSRGVRGVWTIAKKLIHGRSAHFDVVAADEAILPLAAFADSLETRLDFMVSEVGLELESWFPGAGQGKIRVEVDYTFPSLAGDPFVQPVLEWGFGFHGAYIIKVPGWEHVTDESGMSLMTMAGVLFEFYQRKATPSGYYTYDTINTDYVLYYAFSYWFRKFFDPAPQFNWLDRHPLHVAYCFNGFQTPISDVYNNPDLQDFAIGLVPIIEYYLVVEGEPVFGAYRHFFDDLEYGQMAMSSFEANLPHDFDIWLPQFYINYLTDEIYPGGWGSDAIHIGDEVWNVGSPDMGYHEVGTLNDLGMGPIILDLTHGDFNESTSLYLSITSDEVNDELLSLVTLAYNGKKAEYVGQTHEYIIEGIKEEIIDQGYTHLLVLAVNSSHAQNYQGASEVYLDMELRQTPSWPSVWVQVEANVWIDGQYFPEEQFVWQFAEGEISGTEFNYPIDYTFGSGGYYSHWVGHIEGTFNENYTAIQSLRAEHTHFNYSNYVLDSTTYEEVVATGPIPVVEGSPRSFWTWGGETCNKIDLLIHTFSGSSGSDQLTGWDCDITSEIYVGFN